MNMNRFEQILIELKPLMGSTDPKEREKLAALEEELKILQLSEEDKNKGQKFFDNGIDEIQQEIDIIKENSPKIILKNDEPFDELYEELST